MFPPVWVLSAPLDGEPPVKPEPGVILGFTQPWCLSNGMVADSEWVPYATVPFHVDTGDTDGLMLGTLPPQNPSLFRFLELWSGPMSTYRPGTPWYPCVMALAKSGLRRVSYRDLRGDAGDMQGINWVDLQVERRLARNHRYQTYKNFVNLLDSDDSRVS